jgi:hypothetical protein
LSSEENRWWNVLISNSHSFAGGIKEMAKFMLDCELQVDVTHLETSDAFWVDDEI